MIIPPDFLPLISSHLYPSPNPEFSPVMFEVEPSYSLDRITCPPPAQKICSFITPPRSLDIQPLTRRSTSPVSEALRAAINSGLEAVAKEMRSPSVKDRMPTFGSSMLNSAKPSSAKKDSKFLFSAIRKEEKPGTPSAPPPILNISHTFDSDLMSSQSVAVPCFFTSTDALD
jgi:hypothetical protein